MGERVRVALLTELYSPNIGGQEIRFTEIADALARRGHSVEVFCIRSIPGTPTEETQGNIVVHRHPTAYHYQRPALSWLRRRTFPLLRYAAWCRRIPSEQFDFFLFNQWPLAHVLLAPRRMRHKAILDWCEFRSGALFTAVQKYLPRLVRKNIANNHALRQKLEALSGCSFDVVPGGIQCDQYRSAPAEQRSGLLYLGRVTEHKNLPLLVSAYERLVEKGYTGRLRIAGDGPAMASLKLVVQKSPVADRVEILGYTAEQEKIELLARSQILLLTSRREGFPRVVAEAMASGLPVVTVDLRDNGTKDIVREHGIGKVTEPNAEKLSKAVFQVLADWSRYSAAGKLGSKGLDWDVVVDQLLRISAFGG